MLNNEKIFVILWQSWQRSYEFKYLMQRFRTKGLILKQGVVGSSSLNKYAIESKIKIFKQKSDRLT